MNKAKIVLLAAIAAGIAAAAFWTNGSSKRPAADASAGNVAAEVVVPTTFSAEAQMGERAFNGVCATCHGANAAGSKLGPPLVHRIYEPSHHGDQAFEMAAANGVRAHHWRFGDMPPQPALTKADLRTVIAYVRELQRANGIQ